MKTILGALALLITTACFGQNADPMGNASLLERKIMLDVEEEFRPQFYFEPAIGVANAGRAANNLAGFGNYNSEDYKVTGNLVQFGGKMELRFLEQIGIGFEYNYENSGYRNEQLYEDYNWDPVTGLYTDTTFVTEWSETKQRMMLRFYYHFGNTDTWDWYVGAGVGYTHRTQKNPENAFDPFDYGPLFMMKIVDRVFDPFAGRVYIGTRYMFNDHLGLNMEAGIGGGSLLQIGLAVRF